MRATRHGAGFKSEQLVLRHNRAILDNDSTASKGVPISDEDEIKVFGKNESSDHQGRAPH